MRWLRRRRPDPPPPPPPEVQEALDEAREAQESSQERLQEVCDRWPEVREVTSRLRAHRERNGFREMFEAALKRGGDPA
ncbi:DUF7620 family protein [Streptosporangium sp. DT93]|uniref:DUF7620 family protein n=1 Tax=Streptosporangium sp. DT93 TaxID=3393428 RepID=UPI003CF08DEE